MNKLSYALSQGRFLQLVNRIMAYFIKGANIMSVVQSHHNVDIILIVKRLFISLFVPSFLLL